MQYNFDEVVDRSNNHSAKYDERVKNFGTDNVIPLWIADMDFRTAQPIIDALKARAEEGLWGYTNRHPGYFEAIAAWQKKRNNWEIDTSLMGYSLGVVQSISAMVQLFTPKNGKVLIQTPVYPEFYDMTEMAGRSVIESPLVKKGDKWVIDHDDFENKAKEADLFVLCSPHNPLGIVWEKEELEFMVKTCMKYNVKVFSDEIHSDLIFHGKKHIPVASISKEFADYVVTGISGTKTFNLAGLQASTVVFPDMRTKKNFDSFWFDMDIHRNNAFSLIAMETAFREGEDWLSQVLSYINDNFDFVVDFLNKRIPKIKTFAPDATYLMWLDCTQLNMSQEELVDFMIKKAGLGLGNGKAFARSLSGYMRLNVACPRSVLKKALEQLESAVNSL